MIEVKSKRERIIPVSLSKASASVGGVVVVFAFCALLILCLGVEVDDRSIVSKIFDKNFEGDRLDG